MNHNPNNASRSSPRAHSQSRRGLDSRGHGICTRVAQAAVGLAGARFPTRRDHRSPGRPIAKDLKLCLLQRLKELQKDIRGRSYAEQLRIQSTHQCNSALQNQLKEHAAFIAKPKPSIGDPFNRLRLTARQFCEQSVCDKCQAALSRTAR
jgi:hypothetical protein